VAAVTTILERQAAAVRVGATAAGAEL